MSFADPLNCFSKAFFLNRAPTSVQTRVVMCSERLDAPRTSFQCRPANSDLANETNRSRFGERGVLTFSSCIKEGSGRGKGDRGRETKERRGDARITVSVPHTAYLYESQLLHHRLEQQMSKLCCHRVSRRP